MLICFNDFNRTFLLLVWPWIHWGPFEVQEPDLWASRGEVCTTHRLQQVVGNPRVSEVKKPPFLSVFDD